MSLRLIGPWRAARPALSLAVAGLLAACASSPLPPWTPKSSAPAPAPAPAPAATAAPAAPITVPPAPVEATPAPAPTPYPAAVAARFPDPAVNYRTPAFEFLHSGFTGNAELAAALRPLVRERSAADPTTVRALSLGNSQAGEPLQALVFFRAEAAAEAPPRNGRPTVLLVAQQHGDEPAGAEALLVIAQSLAGGPLNALLQKINVVVLPRANPDGAAKGQRETADGTDSNRDQLLLRTPEARAQARLVREFQPVVVVDAHEYHASGRFVEKFNLLPRYDALLQYAMTPNVAPFITKAAEEWFREPMVAALQRQGLSSQWYHTVSSDPDDKKVSMGGLDAENARNANGLKNAVSFLVETRGVGLGRTHLKRRVFTHVTAIESVLRSAGDRAADLAKLRAYVEADISAQACQGQVVVRADPTPTQLTLQALDPVTGEDRNLPVSWNSSVTLLENRARTRPCGYWLAAERSEAVARLRALGVRVEQVVDNGVVQGEAYRETGRNTDKESGRVLLEVNAASTLLDLKPGSFYVPMSQPLANLVAAALEPDNVQSYVANGLADLDTVARVLSLPGSRLTPVP